MSADVTIAEAEIDELAYAVLEASEALVRAVLEGRGTTAARARLTRARRVFEAGQAAIAAAADIPMPTTEEAATVPADIDFATAAKSELADASARLARAERAAADAEEAVNKAPEAEQRRPFGAIRQRLRAYH